MKQEETGTFGRIIHDIFENISVFGFVALAFIIGFLLASIVNPTLRSLRSNLAYFINPNLKKKKLSESDVLGSDAKATNIALLSFIFGLFFYFFSWVLLDEYKIQDDEHYELFGHFTADIGLIFIAIGLVDFVQKKFMHTHFRKEIIDEIKKIAPLYKSHHELGILEVSDKLPELSDLIRNSDSIEIVQTFIPNLLNYQDDIIYAIKNNEYFKLKIFLLDPTSTNGLTIRRNEVIDADPINNTNTFDCVKSDIESNERVIDAIINHLALDSFEKVTDFSSFDAVKKEKLDLSYSTYDLLPAASIYKFDNIAYVGFYVYGTLAINTPQLKVDLTKGIGLKFQEHLDYLKTFPDKVVLKKAIEKKVV